MMKEMQEFIAKKAGYEKKSGETVSNYKRWLTELCNILDISTIEEFLALTADDLEDYIEVLQSHNNQSSSIWSKCIAIQSFYTYLVKRKVCTENVMKDVTLPDKEQKEFLPPTREHIEAILEAAKKNKTYYTLFYFLAQTGARISETLDIKVDAFVNGSVKLFGKGKKERTVFLSEEAMGVVESYIKNDRKEHVIVSEEEFVQSTLAKTFASYDSYVEAMEDSKGLLFVSRNGKRIDKANIFKSFKKYAVKAGIDTKKYSCSCHKIRTSFATNGMNSWGISLPEMRDILGHAKATTTMKYYKPNQEQKRQSFSKVPNIGASKQI